MRTACGYVVKLRIGVYRSKSVSLTPHLLHCQQSRLQCLDDGMEAEGIADVKGVLSGMG